MLPDAPPRRSGWRPGAVALRRLAVASVVANSAIVVTGGAVRLTASGLGCPTWPRCTDSSYVPTQEYGVHGLIEFGNRLLTYALLAVVVAVLVAVVRAGRRDLRRLAVVGVLGIPAQAVLGGITVLTGLNPWTVMAHFLLSMLLIGAAVVLLQRVDPEPAPPVAPLLRRGAQAVLVVVAAVLVVGTVVTGSGPHSGDPDAGRTGLDPGAVSQLHADLVFLLVGLVVGLLLAARATGAARLARATAVLLGVTLAQGLLGFVQYWTDLPVVLVGLHLAGACLTLVAAVRVVLAAGPLSAAGVPAQRARAAAPSPEPAPGSALAR